MRLEDFGWWPQRSRRRRIRLVPGLFPWLRVAVRVRGGGLGEGQGTERGQVVNVGARVRFKAHGETGLVCTVVTRDGDDVTLQDPRGRLLHSTPIELLVFAEESEPSGSRAWRGVDEMEALEPNGEEVTVVT